MTMDSLSNSPKNAILRAGLISLKTGRDLTMDRIILYGITLGASFSLLSMGDTHPYPDVNTYKGEQITPETVARYAPPLSRELRDSMEHWRAAHPTLFARLLANPGNFSQLESHQDETARMLLECGYRNLAPTSHNYVLRPPELEGYYCKVATPQSRLVNLIVHAGLEAKLNARELKENSPEIATLSPDTPTYQTLSRMAAYLRLQEVLEANNLTRVQLPKTYVYTPDATRPAQDTNCIVVQQQISDATLLDRRSPELLDLDEELLAQYYSALVGAALWDPDLFLKKIEGTNVLVVTDLEKRDRWYPPAGFTAHEYLHRVGCGIEQMLKRLQHAPRQKDIWTRLFSGHYVATPFMQTGDPARIYQQLQKEGSAA